MVKRAKIILMADGEGKSNKEISEEIGTTLANVTTWTKRWIDRTLDAIEERLRNCPKSKPHFRAPWLVEGRGGALAASARTDKNAESFLDSSLLLEHLHDLEIALSAGQLNHLLSEEQNLFHPEKDALLEAGLRVSTHIQSDDTDARHDGKNGSAPSLRLRSERVLKT